MIEIQRPRIVLRRLGLTAGLVMAAASTSAEPFGPFNYRCFDSNAISGCAPMQQSPFVNLDFGYFYLEDFEDGVLDVPGVTPQQGGILAGFGAYQDSVDEDDGIVNGVNLSSNQSFGIVSGIVTISLTFDEVELDGRLPTHVGLALVNNFNEFVFTAYDLDGNEVGTVAGNTDFVANGSALDDNFMGVSHAQGIASVSISGSGGGMEIDHIQYGFQCGAEASSDADLDGVPDAADNCLLEANPDQRDSNADGFGNACDADLNDDGTTNIIDLGLFKSVFFSSNADADFNGDGVVNAIDLGVLKQGFFTAPGPVCRVLTS